MLFSWMDPFLLLLIGRFYASIVSRCESRHSFKGRIKDSLYFFISALCNALNSRCIRSSCVRREHRYVTTQSAVMRDRLPVLMVRGGDSCQGSTPHPETSPQSNAHLIQRVPAAVTVWSRTHQSCFMYPHTHTHTHTELSHHPASAGG